MPGVDVIPSEVKEPENEHIKLPVIGIIYPPPEVRNIVDKTASFVARNGPEFESRIRQNELGNPKFNFLNVGDPYNAYYQHKVKEFKEGKGQEPLSAGAISAPPAQPSKTSIGAISQKQQELLKQSQAQEAQPLVLKDPPPDYEFIADPPSISAIDLDVVKLTAQFVARNGRSFLTNLMNREQRNYQFDFLRPQHSLFQYFTKLLEQYTKILIPRKGLRTKLEEESKNMHVILDQVKYRAEWEKQQEAQRRKEEQIIERERVAYAQIDWHDFVVVETVDYQIGEIGNFPAPTTPSEVGARVLMQDRGGAKKGANDNENGMAGEEGGEGDKRDTAKEDEEEMQIGSDDEMIDKTGQKIGKAVEDSNSDESDLETEDDKKNARDLKSKEAKDNTQVQDMEEESSSDEDDQKKDDKNSSHTNGVVEAPPLPSDKKFNSFAPPLPPLPPSMDKLVVKKGYDPKQATKGIKTKLGSDEMISPLTGTKISASKVQEHMRIGLLDPRWVEQRDKNVKDKMNMESVYAPGAAIEASLKQLAERRTDIFGIGDEETAIGKKIGEEDIKKDDKITWDGHTSSVEAATRAARANITIEDQIHQIHKVKGLLPDEEKEKIGPKPVISEASTSINNTPVPNSSSGGVSVGLLPTPPLPPSAAIPVKAPLPALPKQPPLPPVSPAVPPAPPTTKPPLPPPPPTMPAPPLPPAPPVILPGGPVPPLPNRPPLIMTPQASPYSMLPPGGTQMPPPPSPFLDFTSKSHLQHGKHPGDKSDDEPVFKKLRTEDSLEPEEQYLAKVQGPITFKIMCPAMPEKAEWKLTGQTIELTLPLTDSVAAVKAKIHELTNMPPGKQKINSDGLFLKDSNSLAYYNVSPTSNIHLQLKERGGRKK